MRLSNNEESPEGKPRTQRIHQTFKEVLLPTLSKFPMKQKG
jgi:hypothetical protein